MNGLKNFYYRAVQVCIALGNYLLKWSGPALLTGPGSIERLPALIRERNIDRVLVVTGRTVPALGLLDGFLKEAKDCGLHCIMYSGAEPDPTIENVEEALRTYAAGACQAIVAVGGGSSMDCAKACGARVANPGKTVQQLAGLLKVRRRLPPLFAVPTTAGTGSETTITAVITDAGSRRKLTMNDTRLTPSCAVLDPLLTAGLPPQTTAITGLDALTHAVEAYTNRFYNTRATREKAREAVRLIGESLCEAYVDGGNLAAREKMLLASHYAGIAFTRAGVGYVHSTGHTLGGLYHVPHGLAMAVLLPRVLRLYGSAAGRRLSELAAVLGLEGDTRNVRAEAFISWIEELEARLGIPQYLDVVRDEDVEQMIRWSLAEANPLYPVPARWGKQELRRLLGELGRQPSDLSR